MNSPLFSPRESGMAQADSNRIGGVTGVILAGGASSRMGSNKALLRLGGIPLIERVYQTMNGLFDDILIVTNTPEAYAFIPCRTVADLYPGAGSIAGLHAGMTASSTERIFVAACDMPFLNSSLIRMLCGYDLQAEAVVPLNDEGFFEPLHAVYAVSAREKARQVIEHGDRSILILLDRLRTVLIPRQVTRSIPGAGESFRNINTPGEFREALQRS